MQLPPRAHRNVASRVLGGHPTMLTLPPPHRRESQDASLALCCLALSVLAVSTVACRGPAPGRGQRSARVTVEATTREPLACPVVAGISAHPLSVRVGASLLLSGVATQEDVELSWSGRGGHFSSVVAKETEFSCLSEGDHPLTLTVRKPGCPDDAKKFLVTCTPSRTNTQPSSGFAGSGL